MDGEHDRLDDLAAELDEAEEVMNVAVAAYEAKGAEYEQEYRQKYFPRPRHLRVVRDSVAVAFLLAGAGWLFGALGRYRVALAAGVAGATLFGTLIIGQAPDVGDEITSDPPGRAPGVPAEPTLVPTLGPSAPHPPSPGPSVTPLPGPLATGGADAPPSQAPEPSGMLISVPSLPPSGSPTASPTSPRTPSPTATRTPRPTTTPTAPPPSPSPTPTPTRTPSPTPTPADRPLLCLDLDLDPVELALCLL